MMSNGGRQQPALRHEGADDRSEPAAVAQPAPSASSGQGLSLKALQDRSSTGAVKCPFCDSRDTKLISPFGSQLLTSQRRCRACHSFFEALRDDR